MCGGALCNRTTLDSPYRKYGQFIAPTAWKCLCRSASVRGVADEGTSLRGEEKWGSIAMCRGIFDIESK
jgi:hypothetical protein